MKLTRWTWIRLFALMLSVTVIWCYNWDRSPSKWSIPVDYHEDSLMVMGWINSAADGDFIPFLSKEVHRLGAPYEANWNDWPVWGEEIIFGLGFLARWFGLFTAANLGVLLGHLSTALAFYICCRILRFRWEWSFVGAVLFSFTYFHSYRSLHHLMHTYSHTVPLAIICGWLIGFGRRLRWGHWTAWLCLATSFVMGLSNPYNLNMLAQFICLGILLQLLLKRRKVNLQVGAACLGIITVCFLAINLDTFVYQWQHGKNEGALQRGYYETELFALKPMELIVPPTSHHIAAMARLGAKYLNSAYLKGEVFSPYLGIVALMGLIWMAYECLLVSNLKRPKPGRMPVYAPQILWVILYSVVGGFNCMIALGGLPLFRGTNRYSIFISALALMFLASRLSWITKGWTTGKRFALASGILAVGLYDELPLRTTPQETASVVREIRADRDFGALMESRISPGGMIFQLPVVPYPESTPIQALQAYEHLRPFFHTKTLRFSFGSVKGRAREQWQKQVEQMPAQQMIEALERYGFSGIYLNRKGFADKGESLIGSLAAAGRNQMIEDSLGEQVCVLLTPASKPELPPAEITAVVNFPSGWLQSTPSPNGTQYLAGGNAEINFVNSFDLPTPYGFSAQIAALVPQEISIEFEGREVWEANLNANQIAPVNVVLQAPPGKNTLRIKTDLRLRPTRQEPFQRLYVVINPQVRKSP